MNILFTFGYFGFPGPLELMVIFLLMGLVIIWVLYLGTLQRVLSRCSTECRTLSPGLVWLELIPLFNFFWSFILVISISRSLGNEFTKRGIVESPNPGQGVGLAMAICAVLSIIPFLGVVIGIAGFICWIVYWVKIAGYSSKIAIPQSAQPTTKPY